MQNTPRSLIVILVAAGLLGAMRPAGAGASEENDFFARINGARRSHGLAALAFDGRLADVARRHSQDMAARQQLYHNDDLPNQVSGWRSLGENVGEGASVADVDQAFLESPEHRDNILGHFTKLGVGAVWRDGTVWVTEVFELPEQQASPPSSTRTRAPAPPVATRPVVRGAERPAVRTAGSVPQPGTAPIAPVVPFAVAVPLTSGKIEKLLGDLMIVPPDGRPSGQAPVAPPRFGAGLKAMLWKMASDERLAA